MARIQEPTEEQMRWWKKRLEYLSEASRSSLGERFNPWALFRRKSTGQHVTVAGIGEDSRTGRVTLTVNISTDTNFVLFDRYVSGVDPDDLEPCEPPSPEEQVGEVGQPSRKYA